MRAAFALLVFTLSPGLNPALSQTVAAPDAPSPLVSFTSDHASAYDLISAIATQTHLPIGIALGQDPKVLFAKSSSFNLRDRDPEAALQQAISGTGYTLRTENNVIVLYAGDLTPRQLDLLHHPFQDFEAKEPSSLVCLGVQLTMWLRAFTDPDKGFGASIGHSVDEEKFTLALVPSETTEEIANRIVTLGSKGLWIFSVAGTDREDHAKDGIQIIPYQHFYEYTGP